jgi:membrane protein DedA with SNARE-associated domain
VLALFNFTSCLESSGYATIFILSVLQSCCVPASSELTLGFAGVLASESKLSLAAVIAVAAAGELVGAYIAWFIGRRGGRAFVDRYGRFVLLSHRDLDRVERWYECHERWGVFSTRLLPVIRNFAAMTAGVAEVPPLRFGALTAFGSLIWDGTMAAIGYAAENNWRSVMDSFSYAGYMLGGLAMLVIVFAIYHRYRSYRAASTQRETPEGQVPQEQCA